jgi:lysophospholipase L1-like esterase
MKKRKIIKILFINCIIFFSLIFIFEIFFGYWFKKNNFGFLMRTERQKQVYYETIQDQNKYRFYYKRNFYGFRGEEVDPKNIKIVFLGGSAGNQKFTPENLTIVGLLNTKLDKDGYNFKIYNGSTDGKSTRGYANDFKYWFPIIPNFNPKIVIFYTGINDLTLSDDMWDYPWRESAFEKFRDYIKNNSKIIELIKKVKFKYFIKLKTKHGATHRVNSNLYKNFNYINYYQAKKMHYNKFPNELWNYSIKKLLSQFEKRLEVLDFYIIKYQIIPVFITQINYDGLSNYNLYLINEKLKEFCKKRNYNIIKLDEKIISLERKTFLDPIHTLIKGNKIIANKIYPDLLNIFKTHLLN